MRHEINALCARLGLDPLLVQGAGGNVSWKNGDELWVKASGTWLSRAQVQDIFVPVDLPTLTQAISAGNFAVKPQVLNDSALRPSIETVLHALMPHPVVVHVHAVEALTHLVRPDALAQLRKRLAPELAWVHVDYRKPGAELAQAIHQAMAVRGVVDIVFLQNHGMVIGAATADEAQQLLQQLCAQLSSPPRPPWPRNEFECEPADVTIAGKTYVPVVEPAVHSLACDPALWGRLQHEWALYPDHVVFLGPRPCLFENLATMRDVLASTDEPSNAVFVQHVGCFLPDDDEGMLKARAAQLQCYYHVLARLGDAESKPLSHEDVSQLLNWDAENYRLGKRSH